ncbi:hypothetical protein CYMTET_25191 [Cymbomonas tetramitiformis]|uniref:Uncharacterized protein n=1 Tax=Cymbomonas tetramitiformis TaxID=36881 RepID=A0AAE0FVT8_9CHLO|nr:hypothetical protein CYMTET_25191 [Cymbomonas tetramitiformis]|eukprot:gene1293-biopygen1132
MQTAAAEQQAITEITRTYLPASAIRCVHDAAFLLPLAAEEHRKLFRAYVYVVVAFVTFSRPQTGTAMLRESLLRDNNGLSIVLEKEKGKNHLLWKHRLCIPVLGVAKLHELLNLWEQTRVGVVMKKVCFFGGWVQLSSAMQDYIDPTAVADDDMVYYFDWMTPGWHQT